ncbi:SRPBCC family protein [Devosia sp.]|uniref:SRPBCC family protein n=1 Tax=Devosia sp. TaxID=1871048 RepID=UPI002FC58D18
MNDLSYTTRFTVPQSPAEAYAAIINVRGWWSENINGPTDRAGEAFDYRFRDVHRCRIEVTGLVPASKVTWHVLDNYFNFTADKSEWTGTDIVFDISSTPEGTQVTFTHIGLVPDYECFDICSDGWGTYIRGSLQALIITGQGHPNVGEPLNDRERSLTA